jgi:hypothetical protein
LLESYSAERRPVIKNVIETNDLRTGLSALPTWMQDLVREVIADQRSGRAAMGANK